MKHRIIEFDVDMIFPNRRIVYTHETIETMCSRVCSQVMEPIEIRFTGERFEIADGEKRWRACKRLGRRKIPVIIVS